jgi:hypothetical protein
VITDFERQVIVDEEQLRLLAIGYWVWGGFVALYALFMAGYFGVIGSIFIAIANEGSDAPPAFLGWVFFGVGAAVLALVGSLAALEIATGFWIHRRRHRVATLVVAALLCPAIPFGTLLGVSTFVVMSRPTVKAMFGGDAVVAVPPAPVEPSSGEGLGQ